MNLKTFQIPKIIKEYLINTAYTAYHKRLLLDIRILESFSKRYHTKLRKISPLFRHENRLDLLRRLRWKIMIICTFRQNNDIIYKWTVRNFCFSCRWKKNTMESLNDVTFHPTRQMTKNDYKLFSTFNFRSTPYDFSHSVYYGFIQ